MSIRRGTKPLPNSLCKRSASACLRTEPNTRNPFETRTFVVPQPIPVETPVTTTSLLFAIEFLQDDYSHSHSALGESPLAESLSKMDCRLCCIAHDVSHLRRWAFLFSRTQRLHAGLTCDAPTALRKRQNPQALATRPALRIPRRPRGESLGIHETGPSFVSVNRPACRQELRTSE